MRSKDVVEFANCRSHRTPEYKGFVTQSLYVTMRDSVNIAIDVVLPKNLPSNAKIPAMMIQTRYWRASEMRAPFKWFQRRDQFLLFFTSYGYAVVLVDVRGTGASFGTRPYPWTKDEIMDGSEIANWIVSQPWSNGKIGAYGISYVGATAELLTSTNNPAVKAVIPRFSQFDCYTDIPFPGGLFNTWFIKQWARLNQLLDKSNAKGMIAHISQLLHEAETSLAGQLPKDFHLLKNARALRMGRLAVKGVKPVDSDRSRHQLKEAIQAHATNGNVYELAQGYDYRDDIRKINSKGFTIDDLSIHSFRKDIERSKAAIYTWGSWFDSATADNVIRRFLTYSSPLKAIIGPWNHGARFHASPYQPCNTPVDPSETVQWLECLRFFDQYLRGVYSDAASEKVLVYYTLGEEKWKTTEVWPPANSTTQRCYFAKDNTLSQAAPKTKSGADTYTIDFETTTGKANRWHTLLGGFAVVYPDRAEQDNRLLNYTSPPLTEDIEITGHPIVTLYVTSTATDGAFFVYLEDVDESGKVIYVTEGQLRGIHRKVSADPYSLLVPYHTFKKKDAMPLVPGEVAELTFGLLPTSVLIRKGHQIRVAIAGHDKDTFARMPPEGTPVITVARNKQHASFIDLPIIQPS